MTAERFAVRPEKIRMAEPGSGSVNGAHTERGHIREVVYAGMVTRYLVDLDQGGELQVVRQNLETSSSEALDAKGKEVLLRVEPGTHARDRNRLGGEGRRGMTKRYRHVLGSGAAALARGGAGVRRGELRRQQ